MVAELLRRYGERKQAEALESIRIQRMVDIIDEYDETLLLEGEDDIVHPDNILQAASRYLHNLRDQDIRDELDRKARLASLYILATLDGPYSYGEMLVKNLEHHPVSDSDVKLLMRQYVVEKYGQEAWLSEYDETDFFELFSEMTHFDGDSVGEILRGLPLIEEIRNELDEQGFAFKHKKGEA